MLGGSIQRRIVVGRYGVAGRIGAVGEHVEYGKLAQEALGLTFSLFQTAPGGATLASGGQRRECVKCGAGLGAPCVERFGRGEGLHTALAAAGEGGFAQLDGEHGALLGDEAAD